MKRDREPFSPRTAAIHSRLRGAELHRGVCPYCGVGCGQAVFTKAGEIIDIEGDLASPVNEGRQCPKGADCYQFVRNPHRVTKVKYRAPHSDHWEERPLGWALDRVAQLIKESRDAGFKERDEATGITVNNVENVALLGGTANDNEECYLLRKLFTGGLGLVPVENSSRLCHSSTVAALVPSFGFGASTNPVRDLQNSDCILIMGSNIAEAHPVAFYWPVQAQKKGAMLVHVDPRFTRTSAVCDVHIGIRPGTDLAFYGGIIRYILENDLWFDEYVKRFTNAATLISPDFAYDEETGLFAGYDPATDSYANEPHAWEYQMEPGPDGQPKQDPSLQDPQCVFQILRRVYAPYTPEKVAEVCGCRPQDVVKVAELLSRSSGRERTSAICLSLGATQHAAGAQIIRAAAMVQLLLGNIGRPGGGLVALRGHANVQGATDVSTLFGTLPNYLPMPHATPKEATLAAYLASGHAAGASRGTDEGLWKLEAERGAWASLPQYMVSLLKAWYGDAATPDNEFGYQWLPKLDEDESTASYFLRMHMGDVDGLVVVGQNPAVTNPNARLAREALRKLRWLVVLDLLETETAAAWYADPTGPPSEEVGTEVIMLPAAAVTEKDGSFANTDRLLQWHRKAVDPPDDARSDAWIVHQLGLRLKALYADSDEPKDAPMQALTWDYDHDDLDVDVEQVLAEMNGFVIGTGERVAGAGDLRADGSTACGCRLYAGVYPAEGNLSKRLERGPEGGYYPEYRYAWPANSRILYNRASADAEGKPWSERKKLVWWDAGEGRWTGLDRPDFDLTKAPDYLPAAGARGGAALPGDAPFTVHIDGRGWLFAPYGLKDGPLPVYYEPPESPCLNPVVSHQWPPGTYVPPGTQNRLAPPADPDYPLVATTYRLTEHYNGGSTSRQDGWLVELQPEQFAEISPELARCRGLQTGDWAVISTPRASIEMRVVVTPRLRLGPVAGQDVEVVGLMCNFGYIGEAVGAIVNDLPSFTMSPDSDIHGAKSFVCQLRAGRLTGARQPSAQAPAPVPGAGVPVPDTAWAAQPEGREP